MFIEFTGMVGSGKSTIAAIAKEILEDCGLEVLSSKEAVQCYLDQSVVGKFIYRLVPVSKRKGAMHRVYWSGIDPFYRFLFILQNPKLIWDVYRSSPALRDLPRWHRKIIMKLFLQVGGQYQFLHARVKPGQIVILEEGLLHRAINLFAWEMKELDLASVKNYLRLLPCLGPVVFTQAPYEVCLERAKARGLPPRLAYYDEQRGDRFMENAERITRQTELFLSESDRKVIVVDNTIDLGEDVPALMKEQLKKQLLESLAE